jgi:hypothetical protein
MSSPANNKKLPLGCTLLLGLGGLMFLLIIMGLIIGPDKKPPAPPPSKHYEAGLVVGKLQGLMDANMYTTPQSDERLELGARRGTGNTRFDTPGGQQEWIDGYKAGYREGWYIGKNR